MRIFIPKTKQKCNLASLQQRGLDELTLGGIFKRTSQQAELKSIINK